MTAFKDITGTRFGRLVVLRVAGRGPTRWECVCDCGALCIAIGHKIKSGHTKSCGCLRKETIAEIGRASSTHGMNGKTEYSIWQNMKDRCLNPRSKDYANYGGRGVSVCEKWLTFEGFFEDMGNRPSLEHSLDRIDNDGHYSKENCHWATQRQQHRNKRTNKIIEFNGESLCAIEWAERLSMPDSTLHSRLDRGWSVERALTEPVHR